MDDVKFCIYSVDAVDPVDPTTATDYTYLYADPKYGQYDPEYGWQGRGSDIPTPDGMFHQDFGVNVQDRKIRIQDDNAIPQSIKDALQLKYEAIETEWFFTDGKDVYRVVFLRNPSGFKTQRNVALYVDGMKQGLSDPDLYCWYSYEIILSIIEVVSQESSSGSGSS